ncbi:2-C-methyl-D-erythritol 4-phosphate cytidylyltransferase [Flavobacterium sp. W21_SRS_FM6]|uniref:2-C-methyl-D-erythritol 4-phosphate cytidylyltransferase n=1 Tax=Flavobacterium sp. W21_SRS_FM6 TaxID=3240268 RepID=UPI003F92F96C
MTLNSTFTVVVPAAGIGKRMGAAVPKQYLFIAEKTVIEHTLSNLMAHPQIAKVVVVLHPEDHYFKELNIARSPKITTVIGGDERSDSVLAGLAAVNCNETWVLVHDAARPCLHHDDLSALLQLAEHGQVGGILATPVRDTMKRGNPKHLVVKTESRDHLWHALTPQLFPLKILTSALSKAQKMQISMTDEASAIEYFGGQVKLVSGRASNIKITQHEDLLLAEFYLSQLLKEAK